MFMFGRRDLFLTRLREAKQKFGIGSAALCANNCRARIDFAQLGFEWFDLLRIDKIDLVQKQDIRAFDLRPGGMTQFGEANQHVCIDNRNDAVQPALSSAS